MLTSYRVACPHEGCGWSGSLVPSLVRGGDGGEVAVMQRAWLHCPGCGRDWEVRVVKDAVEVAPTAPAPPRRAAVAPLAGVPATHACRACGAVSSTEGAKTVRVEMRPVLTAEVFAFPEALAEVSCLRCKACGHWACLDYRIELDDNPEIDLNPE